MTDDLEDFPLTQTPTAERPLLGLTVLVVEDSRFACEAMRLLCLRSGARIRRADSLKSARRHLIAYRPSVLIVDLGLPDGSGADLIRDLAASTPRIGVLLGTSGDAAARDELLAAGADGFLEKPIESLSAFQQAILQHLPLAARPRGIRLVSNDKIIPDRIALRDDLAHVSDALTSSSNDPKTLAYLTQFLTGIARSSNDNVLELAAKKLNDHRISGKPIGSNLAELAGIVQQRLVGPGVF
jgi:two-component system OmpR family response regulator